MVQVVLREQPLESNDCLTWNIGSLTYKLCELEKVT